MVRVVFLASLALFLVLGCAEKAPEAEKAPKVEKPAEKVAVTLKKIDEVRVACLERTGPYEKVGDSFGELMAWMGSKGVKPVGPPMGTYYDDPTVTPPDKTRYEVCMPVAEGVEGDETVKVKVIPSQDVASTRYKGPWEKVAPTYLKLFAWIEENGYKSAGPPTEVYLNSPKEVKPEELLTDIRVPVVKM